MANQTADWIGASGKKYSYWVYPLPASIKSGQDGNYIFTKVVNNTWVPIYIGQGDIGDRLDNHHQATCIKSKGATHLHAHKNADERARLAEEDDLLAAHPEAYAPAGCNIRRGG